jgi:glycosyltransferase involved in cell wall biosynthesis
VQSREPALHSASLLPTGAPRISVVIPAYKAAGTIARAVDSALAQTLSPHEILIIDDGSPDDIAGALAHYARHPRGNIVRHVRQANAGASAARNHGIELATGDVIAFLDADDYWEPDKLRRQADILRDHPQVGLVASRHFTQAPGAERVQHETDTDRWLGRPVAPTGTDAFDLAGIVWTGTVMIRRSALADRRFVSGLEPAEDRDLWVRMITAHPAYVINEPLATAVLEPNSLSRSDPDFGYGPMIQVLRRHEKLVGKRGLRRLEARVYRGWAAAHLSRGSTGLALRPALERLRRQPWSVEGSYIVAKALLARISHSDKGIGRSEPRSIDSLRRHFDIERELADKLRAATPEQRKGLYGQVYNELFRRVPDHPQNTRKANADTQRALANSQWRLLKHFVSGRSTYLEVGAGDCHLPIAIADVARNVYAVDVSDVIADGSVRPANFKLVLSDGIAIDVPPGSVDVAYSNQLMEHLHPDDAAAQLGQIAKALAPGGTYLVITPHRLSGPHDISKFFSTKAEGFHLKEYTYRELRQLFRAAGLINTSVWAGLKGRFFKVPESIVLGLESVLGILPRPMRRFLTRSPLLRPIFINVTLAGALPQPAKAVASPNLNAMLSARQTNLTPDI